MLEILNMLKKIKWPAKQMHRKRTIHPTIKVSLILNYWTIPVCNRGVKLYLFCHGCPFLDNKR